MRVRRLPADAPLVPWWRRMMMPCSMRALRDPDGTSLTRGPHGRCVPGLWDVLRVLMCTKIIVWSVEVEDKQEPERIGAETLKAQPTAMWTFA